MYNPANKKNQGLIMKPYLYASFIPLLLTLFGCSGSEDESTVTAKDLVAEERVVPPAPAAPVLPVSVSSNFTDEVLTSELLLIQFDQPLDVFELSYNSQAGACGGDIQLSSDNFVTCNALSFYTGGTQKIELQVGLFQGSTNYQLKIRAGVESLFGGTLAQDHVSSFVTLDSAGLMITEVGAAPFTNSQNWFEIYNTTNHQINLSSYEVVSKAFQGTCNRNSGCDFQAVVSNYIFQLPNKIIEPGQYHVIKGHSWYGDSLDGNQVSYIGDINTHPYWQGHGFLDLRLSSSHITQDFLIFGDWSQSAQVPTPSNNLEWVGVSAISLPYTGTERDYGSSIVRNAILLDSNKATDWRADSFQTPGGPNDVECNLDDDLDGLPDCSERPGTTYAGIDIYSLGAREAQRDIFIELDYMASADEGITPRLEALEKVVDAFSAKDIAIHFDAGDLFDPAPGINLTKFDLGGGNEVPFNVAVGFDPSTAGIDNLYDIKRQNIDYARNSIFHYMLMANSQNADGSGGSGGIAEINANDSIITLGDWGLNSSTTEKLNELINIQASTIMHELGHNLGLLHGGNENINYKPNYLSVMNYLYAITGLPTIGNNEGDRFYLEYCSGYAGGLVNSPREDYQNFNLDYSAGVASQLNELSVSELSGLGMVNSTPVDFNCNNSLDITGYEWNLNGSGGVGMQETLTDHDDWSNLNLKFQHSYSSNENLRGESAEDNPEEFYLVENVIGNDRAQVVVEDVIHRY